MNTRQPLSRKELQALPEVHRIKTGNEYVQQVYQHVYGTALTGRTSYTHTIVKNKHSAVASGGYTYQLTSDDIVEAFKRMFPECDVRFSEDWVDVRQGVREQREQIVIDWS